ncbi:MAG: 2-oxo acid dehydrogenase subunit E2 [Candidatus Nanopelagicales bacterium]|nr:2-oxo acid dehydrogenase subunit E2 [Candidatus Nanopelagicales bacterium]MCF8537249.1 2-oxo acid dehydrogenase subunit E2 [Candidatus Nanopelagicales bacterium]MCF8542601.1 2-oxo acid dehydrogenase subunit E2 [Candidatus Nanopelagicales bacterium]MCF8557006.1 2-oxo acid dehydrogenase subunit E2 [Candidatus Nanopelagicales bacterium]
MAIEIRLPKLGLTMEEGTVDEWLLDDGAAVVVGMPILRLATDKIDVDVEAEAEGILHRAVGNGVTLEPGAVLGWLLGEGEQPPAGGATPAAAPSAASVEEVTVITTVGGGDDLQVSSADGRVFISPNARRVATELGVELSTVRGSGPGGRIVSEDVEEAALRSPAPAGPAKVASPLARRDAREAGIDPSSISTSTGYVTRGDVKAAASAPQAAAAAAVVATSTLAAVSGQETSSIIPMKGMRGTIAARMQQSLTEMAQLTHGFEVGMDAVVALRSEMKEQYAALGVPVPSLNDFVVRAAALALRQHPILNATIDGNEIHLLRHIHMGLAVAVPNGLMVPVIRDADTLSLPELARATREAAERCREGTIGLDELEGGTFAVTSLGTYGVDMFTPVINPGNVGILGVGRLRDSGKWEGDDWVRTQVLTLSLTFDHRAVDGAPAAEYLQTMHELLARPLVLVS